MTKDGQKQLWMPICRRFHNSHPCLATARLGPEAQAHEGAAGRLVGRRGAAGARGWAPPGCALEGAAPTPQLAHLGSSAGRGEPTPAHVLVPRRDLGAASAREARGAGHRARPPSAPLTCGHTRNRWQRDFPSGSRFQGLGRRLNFSLVTLPCGLTVTRTRAAVWKQTRKAGEARPTTSQGLRRLGRAASP